jgi:hypothetical protein
MFSSIPERINDRIGGMYKKLRVENHVMMFEDNGK